MNRGIWMVAAWLVAKHRADAPKVVHSRIMALRRELADERHIASWLLIDDAVNEWLRVKPRAGDPIH